MENGVLRFRNDLPAPTPSRGEALVRVEYAGICGTDLGLLRGYAGFTGIPGHEFCGRILESSDLPQRIGEVVVGEINHVCGRCRACRRGSPNHCERREVLGIRGRDGAFAEMLRLPLGNLHSVPDTVSAEAAVFTEPLAAAVRITEQIRANDMAPILVVGAGRLGQLIARALHARGAAADVVVRHDRHSELLQGLNHSIIREEDVTERSYRLVVEATGAPSGFQLALSALQPLGTLVLKSTYPDPATVDLSRVVVDEIQLIGSRCGPFPAALDLLKSGLEVESLIDGILPLEECKEAFRRAALPGAMKILLRP